MSGFRDSLKGRYYGELGSGFVLIVRRRGGDAVEGERAGPVMGVGQLFRRGGGRERRGDRREGEGGETVRPSAPGPVPGK